MISRQCLTAGAMIVAWTVIVSAASVAANFYTSPSPLRAFKQLGFDGVMDRNPPINPGYGGSSYSMSSYGNSYPQKPGKTKAHPNDILSNMGVKLPATQILGKSLLMSLHRLAKKPAHPLENEDLAIWCKKNGLTSFPEIQK